MEVFPIAPAGAKPLWFLAVVCLVLAAVIALLAFVAWSSLHSRVELSERSLRLVGDLWGRSIPLASLDVAGARVLALDAEPDLQPVARTWGTGLPGYASGWLRLRNGEQALAYLTRNGPVLHVPTRDGYALLLSVAEPEALLAALRARASR